jgi:hypothetical protein
LEGWCIGGNPFRSEEHRQKVWNANREYLLSKCPPETVAAAAREYDGDDRPLPSVLHHYAMGGHDADK